MKWSKDMAGRGVVVWGVCSPAPCLKPHLRKSVWLVPFRSGHYSNTTFSERPPSAPYLEEPSSFEFHNEMLGDARRMPVMGLEPGTHDNCPM